MTVEQELVELERAGWEALSTSADAAANFYREALASRVLMLLPGGMVIDDRRQAIEAMRGAPWDSFELTGERVLVLGDAAAAVTYVAVARRGDQDYTALFNSTYVREEDRWRLALHQQTPI
jgi:hypothetical protein